MGSQIQDRISSFIVFSVAIDESADVGVTAQLCAFNRGVDVSLTVTEDFFELIPMKDTTTACDMFCYLIIALHKGGAHWSRVVGLAVDDIQLLVGKNAGQKISTKFREKVQAANVGQDLWIFHCI